MLILGIESTCDETAAAVVRDGTVVLSNVVASQVALHARFGGVVPEIASRAHIEQILPVVGSALAEAKVGIGDVDAVAVAHRPGLIGSLLVGVTAAKTLAWAAGKPLMGVDHVHAHLWSVMLDGGASGEVREVEMPAVGLVVSGGHTAMYQLRDWQDVTLVGSTIDDAVGEAYDKVAAILGLGYPGGPLIDALAAEGGVDRFGFPRPLLGRGSLDFSFSGLKTAVLYHVRGVPGRTLRRGSGQEEIVPAMDAQRLRDTAASFQLACVDTIVEKLRRGIVRFGPQSVIVGGGVSANRALRNALGGLGLPVYLPRPAYCTDNAAMAAGLAYLDAKAGRRAGLELDAVTSSRFREASVSGNG